MSKRLETLFSYRNKKILTIYFTAGFPKLEDTLPILQLLEKSGADLVEIGMPYSDPIADGETIQQSNGIALQNGMSLKVLFSQLQNLREKVSIPVLLMGYLNPVMQFGMENFCKKAQETGIDGVILPDLPFSEYKNEYRSLFSAQQLSPVFLITPQTTENRIREIDELSESFIYAVSSASTTGSSQGFGEKEEAYFKRLEAMSLRNPIQIGFGISDKESYQKAVKYSAGAIIGSAFIKKIAGSQDLERDIRDFIESIRS